MIDRRALLKTSILAAALVLGLAGAASPASAVGSKGLPSRIQIELTHMGLFRSETKTYVIDVANGAAKRGGEGVPLSAIAALLSAIGEPPLASPTLGNLGMTSAWLGSNSKAALDAFDARHVGHQPLDAKQATLFSTAFADPSNAAMWVALYNSGATVRTDDYSGAKIHMVWADGSDYDFLSTSQSVFMVPWLLGKGGVKTFNAGIARSLAELVPREAPNRARLEGTTLAAAYGDWLLSFQLRDQIDTIATEEALGDQLRPIQDRFAVTSLSLALTLSDDLEGQGGLQAHLTSASLPSNVSVYMTVGADDDRLVNVAETIAAADRYTRLALGVPWLSAYLAANHDSTAQIRVVGNRSVSPHLADSLIRDLREHGKAGLAGELSSTMPDVTYVRISDTAGADARWFVLPEHRMLLWDYRGGTPLQQQLTAVPAWDSGGRRGVAALFDAGGELQP
jgi:hypothetical protein